MWFQDIARDHANKNTQAGAPQNQITFEMLTGNLSTDNLTLLLLLLLSRFSRVRLYVTP